MSGLRGRRAEQDEVLAGRDFDLDVEDGARLGAAKDLFLEGRAGLDDVDRGRAAEFRIGVLEMQRLAAGSRLEALAAGGAEDGLPLRALEGDEELDPLGWGLRAPGLVGNLADGRGLEAAAFDGGQELPERLGHD